MFTIASPRASSRDPLRRTPSSQAVVTPTNSNRPSLDIPRSANGSPIIGPPSATNKRTSRAALREYYNLKKTNAAAAAAATPPLLEVTDTDDALEYSEVPYSEIDSESFDAEAYIKARLKDSSLEELLKTYTRVLGEIRALDAEKKALVYDNYSKLITATETIRKMRANMDPLNPMASTLDPAIAHIYTQASSIREALRLSVSKPEDDKEKEAEQARRKRTQQLVVEVLDTPDRIRALVREGKLEDARQAWKLPRRLLETWKEKGWGGPDVLACIANGDAALRGEANPTT